MPNQEEETRKDVEERTVTKVHGQPTNQDLDLLENELLRIASSIYSELGGGAHGHAGLLLSDVDYAAIRRIQDCTQQVPFQRRNARNGKPNTRI